jgi:phage terminase small subunit
MSVTFAAKDGDATCGVCRSMATNGNLEKLRLNDSKEKFPGANQSGNPRMTDLQKAFAAHPLVTTNPRRAAIEVGYSESYAEDHAHALRKQLSFAIIANQEEARKLSAISAARVQQELASMGFANILDYYDVCAETGEATPKQLNELTREQAAAVQEVEMLEIEDADGTKRKVLGRIKLTDKRAALVELGKTIGLFNKFTIEDRRQNTLDLEQVPTEDLEKVERYLLNAARKTRDKIDNHEAIPGEYAEAGTLLEGPQDGGQEN